MKWKIAIGALCLAVSGLCAAFESWEHKRLGDLAYHIAVAIYCEHNEDVQLCKKQEPLGDAPQGMFDPVGRLPPLENSPPPGRNELTYGDVVACVDYFLSTEKLIAGRESTVIDSAPKNVPAPQFQAEDYVSGLPPGVFPFMRKDFDLAQRSRCDERWTNPEGQRAQHVNHSHFQVEVLVAQRTNHMLAIDLRTRGDNLFSALVLNAISDHYLQDSFAPGHIGAWRTRLTDLAATAYHDRRNRRGMYVEISSIKLLNFAKVHRKVGVGGELREQLLKQLRVDPAARHYFFADPKEKTKPNFNARLEALVDDEKVFDTDSKLHIKGDAQLWKPEQDLQRYFMLLTDVRSILDVLESRREAVDQYVIHDAFTGNSWSWKYVTDVEWSRLENFLLTRPSRIEAQIGPAKYNIVNIDRYSNTTREEDSDNYDSMDRIFGTSIGIDSMSFGDTHNRLVIGLETPIFGKLVPRKSLQNVAWLAGVQPFYDGGRTSVALTTRRVTVFPETEFAFSVQARALRLTTQSHGYKWRPALGARVDAGFTSFVTFYLQTGFDASVQTDDSIRRGWSIGAGIQVAAPQCRIFLLDKLGGCH